MQSDCNASLAACVRVCAVAIAGGLDILECRLRDGYPASLQVFAQALVELSEASQLELGHALLLRLAVAARPYLVGRGRHHGGRCGHGARSWLLGACGGWSKERPGGGRASWWYYGRRELLGSGVGVRRDKGESK